MKTFYFYHWLFFQNDELNMYMTWLRDKKSFRSFWFVDDRSKINGHFVFDRSKCHLLFASSHKSKTLRKFNLTLRYQLKI